MSSCLKNLTQGIFIFRHHQYLGNRPFVPYNPWILPLALESTLGGFQHLSCNTIDNATDLKHRCNLIIHASRNKQNTVDIIVRRKKTCVVIILKSFTYVNDCVRCRSVHGEWQTVQNISFHSNEACNNSERHFDLYNQSAWARLSVKPYLLKNIVSYNR